LAVDEAISDVICREAVISSSTTASSTTAATTSSSSQVFYRLISKLSSKFQFSPPDWPFKFLFSFSVPHQTHAADILKKPQNNEKINQLVVEDGMTSAVRMEEETTVVSSSSGLSVSVGGRLTHF
jgi:hypothetical protein